jgi:hypothetical protein
MNRAADLRRRADRYRRLASIPTSGGHSADRELLVLAEELDDHAADLESWAEPERRPERSRR